MKLRLAIFFLFIFNSYQCKAALAVEDVVVANNDYLSFPDMVKLQSGEILVVYRRGKNHAASDGKIWAIKSDLAGKFSSAVPFVLYDDPVVDDRDPSIYQLKNGEIILTFFKYFYSPVKSTQTFMVRFNHQLKKLSEQRISSDSLKMANSSNLIESNQWGLILPTYGYTNNEKLFSVGFYQAELTSSAWTLFQSVVSGTQNRYWPQEPAIVELASHQLLMMYRTSKESDGPAGLYPMYYTLSDPSRLDQWSNPVAMDTIGHAPKLLRLSHGALIAIFRSLDNFDNHALFRCEVAYKLSNDEGKTWSNNQVIYQSPNDRIYGWDCGYPSIIELNQQDLLAVYYTFRGKSIQIARFSLPNFRFR
ncbi:MAG: sialidase family protein [Bacteriovoracaceae bacterium]